MSIQTIMPSSGDMRKSEYASDVPGVVKKSEEAAYAEK
jgi:hypothetical protein